MIRMNTQTLSETCPMTTLQIQIPDQLLQQGWVANMDELIAESMRRIWSRIACHDRAIRS